MNYTDSTVYGNVNTNKVAESTSVSAVAATELSVAAGAAATLTSGQGTTSGVFHFTSGTNALSLTTGSKLIIAWNGGKRYNVSVSVVSTADITITGGSGDVLPTNGTELTIGSDQSITLSPIAVSRLSSLFMQFIFTSAAPAGEGPLVFRFASLDDFTDVTDWLVLEANQILELQTYFAEAEDLETFLGALSTPVIEFMQVLNGHQATATLKLAGMT